MSIQEISLLHSEFPELFQDRNLPAGWHDDLAFVRIGDPEKLTEHSEDECAPLHYEDSLFVENDFTDEGSAIEHVGPGLLDGGDVPFLDPVIHEVLGEAHAGAPLALTKQSPVPPPDCLAFYLPFHYYHPTWWGIYLILDGIATLQDVLLHLTDFALSTTQAFDAAKLFLYYHEAFHHKTESFATRLELTHRRPFFKTGFERYYQKTFGSDDCLEEGLANATALRDTKRLFDKQTKKIVEKGLVAYILACPPGYSQGVAISRHFQKVRCKFAEDNQATCLPHLPSGNPQVWDTAPHLFDGVSNIKGRVNYVVPRNSPLVKRLPFRPCVSPDKLIRKLRQLVGAELVREGGSHQVWRTLAGRQFEVPRHPRDLGRGLLRAILRQVGLDMGLEEFLAS